MITAAEYRKLAGECFRLACQSKLEPVRTAYLDLARLWLETASRLDGLPSDSTAQYFDLSY
jgi:hypothetical protein